MFHNIQHADEYVCSAAIQKDTNELIMDNVIQDDKHLRELQKIIKNKHLETFEIGEDGKKYCVHDNWTYCYIHNNTYFCEKCAKKLDYKCPVCGGLIKKERSRY
jgi:PHP family Zn ribbon phosphoesterase